MTAPTTIAGRYEVHGEIASGGMATVYYGRLTGAVGFARAVAVKRLHPQYAKDPGFVAMFVDEARLAGRIRHRNVVPVLDVVSERGELVLVLEYVHGESLAKLLAIGADNSPPDIALTARILVDVLEGLHAAHEATSERGDPLEIVHRDVSPQNILVGIDGVARVLDFGVAKAESRMQSTADGQIKGKLAYMSPEQLRSDPVDRRTDVYAAGVVLWEAITGRRLFGGDSAGAILTQILERNVQAPSCFNAGVPRALDDVVMKALARQPSDRFESADAMAVAIEQAARLASARDVGEWVRRSAAATLAGRAAAIDGMEALSIVTAQVRAAPATDARGAASSNDAPITSLSSAAPRVVSGAPRLRGTMAAAVVAVLAAAGVYAWREHAATRGGSADEGTPTTSATGDVPAARAAHSAPIDEASAPVTQPPDIAPTSEPSAADAREPSAARSGPAGAPAAAPNSHGGASVAAPRSHPARKGPACTPPYTIGADGVKRFKPECVD